VVEPPAANPRPSWELPALAALLAGTGVLYVWGLGASGWANTYYSMAVQAGTQSWKAFFFGSLDAGNSVTVDKSPASLWVMGVFARVFGVNAWSVLVPQALEGVAAVGLLYATVRRWFGAPAALIAGAVMALTPVATLMFRFNNPDALLVLCLVAGAYALTRALERGQTWWLVLAFSCVGFGFLAKMLQALIVVPVFALVYLIAGPPQLGRRIVQLVAGGCALLASSLWWVVIVQLWPASSRPYIGGSQNNSIWNLMFGYNGFGRLTGNEAGSVGGGPQGTAGRWGPTGWTRLFNTEYGGQASWLLPAALIVLVAGLVFTWRMPRTDRTRAALLLWGGWLVITGAAFSLGQGIIHPYYTVALAPAIGALIGIGGTRLWNGRNHPAARAVLVSAFAVTVWWAYVLLGRTPTWLPALRTALLIGGLVVVVLLAVNAGALVRRSAIAIGGATLLIVLAAPAAYTLSTVRQTHGGALPTAGPDGASVRTGDGQGGPGGRGGPGGQGGLGGQTRLGGGGAPGRGMNGLLNGSTPSAEIVAVLEQNADAYTWIAATTGANNAAGYQLATGEPVMAIGGFNGTDPSPTLAQFQEHVAQGRVHYFIGGGVFGGGRGNGQTSSTSNEIAAWVASNFGAQTVDGVTVYDLTTGA
jgi:4-amino-4-deoxy-L-arabinose transferase-like glycosyltransferase